MLELIQSVDWSILHAIQRTFKCGFLDFIMPKISYLGNSGMIWLLIAAVFLVFRKYRKFGVLMIIGLVARPRPCWLEQFDMLVNIPKDYSFPSGHTLSSVIGAFIATCANKKFGFIVIPLAALIAFSRLYLCVHFPTDVLSSCIFGILISLAVIFVGKKVCDKYDERKLKKQM